MTLMTPPSNHVPGRSQYLVYFAEGVVINLLTACLCWIVLMTLPVSPLRDLVSAIAGVSIFLGVLNLLPIQAQGMMTDGARWSVC